MAYRRGVALVLVTVLAFPMAAKADANQEMQSQLDDLEVASIEAARAARDAEQRALMPPIHDYQADAERAQILEQQREIIRLLAEAELHRAGK